MIAHAHGTAAHFISLGQKMFTSLALSPRLREIAILTTAATTDCDFVFAQHAPTAAAAGVSQATRTAIAEADWDSPALTADDRTLIAVTREIITSPRITDTTFTVAVAHLP